jgi:hypothetical protein
VASENLIPKYIFQKKLHQYFLVTRRSPTISNFKNKINKRKIFLLLPKLRRGTASSTPKVTYAAPIEARPPPPAGARRAGAASSSPATGGRGDEREPFFLHLFAFIMWKNRGGPLCRRKIKHEGFLQK